MHDRSVYACICFCVPLSDNGGREKMKKTRYIALAIAGAVAAAAVAGEFDPWKYDGVAELTKESRLWLTK